MLGLDLPLAYQKIWFSVDYIFREVNQVVDILAKQGAKGTTREISSATRDIIGTLRIERAGMPVLRCK